MAYNPFQEVPVTGTWEDHASYSQGGTDYPLGYGTPIPAPADGQIFNAGYVPGYYGKPEFLSGWVGSAGRRAILRLNDPIPRRTTDPNLPPQGSGDMVAIVLQHLSQFTSSSGENYTLLEGQGIIGWSGASANLDDWGGDVHLHWHGLTAGGQRVKLEDFIYNYGYVDPAGDGSTPLPERKTDVSQLYSFKDSATRVVAAGASRRLSNAAGAPQNLVGGEGNYIFACNVEGTGLEPGDIADFSLVWHDVESGNESRHFIERINGEEGGVFKRNASFAWPVKAGPSGTTVALEIKAVRTELTITRMACNAVRFDIQ